MKVSTFKTLCGAIIICFLGGNGYSQPTKNSDSILRKKINIWLDQTPLIIQKDTFDLILDAWQATDEDKKKFYDAFEIEKIGQDWYSLSLKNILDVSSSDYNNISLSIKSPIKSDHMDYSEVITFNVLTKSFAYGNNFLRQFYSKVNLANYGVSKDIYFTVANNELELKSDKEVYFSIPMMGQAFEAVIRETIPKESFPSSGLSTTCRDYMILTPELQKYSNEQFENFAYDFFEKDYKKDFNSKARITSKIPPTAYLEHVQGYITTERYWENVQIKFDNIQRENEKLMIQCSIDGEYVKLKTPQITKEAFERPFILEKDYSNQINGECIKIINAFKVFIKTIK